MSPISSRNKVPRWPPRTTRRVPVAPVKLRGVAEQLALEHSFAIAPQSTAMKGPAARALEA